MKRVLNLGCGSVKITGADNVDINETNKPDLIFDIRKEFPIEDRFYDEIYLFHTIEHIEKKYHRVLFSEMRRVLNDNGIIIITYPEFSKVLKYWLDNYKGLREFWEAVIYGRQAYPSDYHVCAIDTEELKFELLNYGLETIESKSEPKEEFNTILTLQKCQIPPIYEEILYRDIFEGASK